MFIKRFANRHQRGDTIVEVMIVLAILGLALSICYATANRSLLNTRQAQENTEATELLRGQVEALRTLACTNGDPTCVRPPEILQSLPFCLKPDTDPDTGMVTYSAPPATDDSCTQGRYHLTVTLIDESSKTYNFKALWDNVQGSATQDSVTLNYRLP